MQRLLPITMLLCAAATALCACSLPETTRPELQADAPYPNLADVPPRPTTISPAEREQMRQDLINDNKAMEQ